MKGLKATISKLPQLFVSAPAECQAESLAREAYRKMMKSKGIENFAHLWCNLAAGYFNGLHQ